MPGEAGPGGERSQLNSTSLCYLCAITCRHPRPVKPTRGYKQPAHRKLVASWCPTLADARKPTI